MNRLRKLLNQIRMLVPALATASPGLGPWLARRRWPQAQGTLTTPGLRAPVEVRPRQVGRAAHLRQE